MKFYIDGCNERAIELAEKFNLGITTNPSIILRDRTAESLEEVIRRLGNANVPQVFIHLEGFERKIVDLLEPSKFVIKLSWIEEKHDLAVRFREAGFRVCATAVYTPQQFLTSAILGVDYTAFYFDRSKRKGFDPRGMLSQLVSLSNRFAGKPAIVVASLKNFEQLREAIDSGANHFTLPVELFEQLLREDEVARNDACEFQKNFEKLVQQTLRSQG